MQSGPHSRGVHVGDSAFNVDARRADGNAAGSLPLQLFNQLANTVRCAQLKLHTHIHTHTHTQTHTHTHTHTHTKRHKALQLQQEEWASSVGYVTGLSATLLNSIRSHHDHHSEDFTTVEALS